MPLRNYEPVVSPCRLCGVGFDVIQAVGDAPLTECPRCGAAVRLRTAAPVNSPQVTKSPSISDAKAAGFTVLKRVERGDYEKQ